MYLTDACRIERSQSRGQLFYRDSSGSVKRIISGGLMFPNGVVLSPDEKMLYIDEWAANRILAVPVVSPGVINAGWSYVFATLSGGHGPDSMTADSAGKSTLPITAPERSSYSPNGDYHGPIRLPEGAGSNRPTSHPQRLPLRHGERKRRDLAREDQDSRHQSLWWFVEALVEVLIARAWEAWLNENLGDHHDGPTISEKRVIRQPGLPKNRSSIRHQLQ